MYFRTNVLHIWEIISHMHIMKPRISQKSRMSQKASSQKKGYCRVRRCFRIQEATTNKLNSFIINSSLILLCFWICLFWFWQNTSYGVFFFFTYLRIHRYFNHTYRKVYPLQACSFMKPHYINTPRELGPRLEKKKDHFNCAYILDFYLLKLLSVPAF